ncbi:MAG: 3-methyl-2-oxobutanoate hydroxymethyltransferase [Spirochaetes bacterium]|nr:3-methyl-2-oxobutanoate hydroxymethyltransferase [Spirochaetota bacterium]
MKKTIEYLNNKKKNQQKITALTSYDYPTTLLLEKAGIDMIILGDSVGTNILGYKDETEVTLEDMIHHAKAVSRALQNIFLVVDLPYRTHETPQEAVFNAKQLLKAGADAVKFEGIKENIVQVLKDNGILVMCHIGLNPQYHQEDMKQGKITRGKILDEAVQLLQGAKTLEKAGADLIILEKIPEKVAKIITENISIPAIGIGAGKYCDGQVLIINDLIGIGEKKFKHAPDYINLRKPILETLLRYKDETEKQLFPAKEHVNLIRTGELEKFKDWCSNQGFKI